jgi:hypothetical protein
LLTPRPRCITIQFAPTTPDVQRIHAIPDTRFGLLPFRSSLLRESRLLSFPPGTEIFHFPGLASTPYGFRSGCGGITRRGFPHSGIPGSTPVSGSPGLIAAYYALPRLRAPRHPPYALLRLTIYCQHKCCTRLQLSKSHACAQLLAPHALLDLATARASAPDRAHRGRHSTRVPRGVHAEPASEDNRQDTQRSGTYRRADRLQSSFHNGRSRKQYPQYTSFPLSVKSCSLARGVGLTEGLNPFQANLP